jgi:hypothetical protein
MKKLFIIAITIFSVGTIVAQEADESFGPKHIISIQAGLAIPSDDLSEVKQNDINTTSAASAASGITAGIDYQRNVSKYIGINVLIRAYSFPIDENTTLGEFKEEFQNDPAAAYTIDSEPYVLGFLGLGFTAQYGSTVQGYVSLFIGYGGMRSPEIVVGQTVGVDYDKMTKDYSSDLSVMYGVDFGIRVKLSKVLLLGINAEYLAASDFEFDGDVSRQKNNDPKNARPYEYDQEFSTFSVALKVGFVF